MKGLILDRDQIEPDPNNLRVDLDIDEAFVESFRTVGIIDPIHVRQKQHDPGTYIVVDGHRRYHAAMEAGVAKFPAILRTDTQTDDEAAAIMLLTDVTKKRLNPAERADGILRLRKAGWSTKRIAEFVGISTIRVGEYLLLMECSQDTIDRVLDGTLSMHEAITVIREVRKQQRAKAGKPARGRPQQGSGWKQRKQGYFGLEHRLAPTVQSMCTHRDRRRVGSVGCGPCWEQAIRDEVREPEPAGDYRPDQDQEATE